MPTSKDIVTIKTMLRPLIGHEAWGASLGLGSFLLLEFGDTVTVPMETVEPLIKGAWHLWLYSAAWRIEVAGVVQAASGDAPEHKEQLRHAIKILNGLRLEAVTISPAFGDTRFQFANATALRTFSMASHEPDKPHWRLTFPDGRILTLGPASNWGLYSATGERSGGSELA